MQCPGCCDDRGADDDDFGASEGQRQKACVFLRNLAKIARNGVQLCTAWRVTVLEPDRVAQILLLSLRDENVNVRYWVVEGLAYLASDAAIGPLLDVFHDDPSPMIRERAACGLAQSGMFSAAQRRTAVPRLLDFAEDGGLDPETRTWVFQALRDITGQSLPHDPAAWRRWYRDAFRTAERPL